MEISKATTVGGSPKTEPPKKETTLDKVVDYAKDHTKKGTLVGDHYVAVGAGTIVGGIAAVAGIAKIADNVPVVKEALEFVFDKNGKLVAGTAAAGAAYMLGEDAIQSFKEGSTVKGLAEGAGTAVAGLGAVELVGRQFDIPVAKEALTKTLDAIGDNAMAIGGGLAAAGGSYAVKKGVDQFKDGNKLAGAALSAGGVVGVLGGAELVGRQFNIPILKEALTGPAKALFNSKGGKIATGGAVGLTGVGTGIDGVRRLTTQKGALNDAIGVAELTAGITAATGGTSLVGMAIGNETLARALPESMEFVGAAAALGTAAALGKHTVESVSKNGVTLFNTATGTGAALAALGGTQLVAGKLGITSVEKAFSKGWEPVLGVGLGVASYKFGAGAMRELKEGGMVNAAGQAGLAFATAAGSAAVLGHSLHIPVLDTFGSKSLEFIGEHIVSPVGEFAVKNPFLTLGAIAVAGGAGAYAYYHNKGEKEGK
ncbi:MAG TPA: hypothetical protein V6D23_09140 [Candidatus Obscuribacterales bacterium]